MREYTVNVLSNDAGKRLDLFVFKFAEQQSLGLSRRHMQEIIKQGLITLNGQTLRQSYRIKAGDNFSIKLEEKKPLQLKAEDIPLDIIYEDKDILVVNKPYGLVVHPAPGNYEHTLVNALLHQTKDLSDINPLRPGIVHRLDKDTSGLMVVAKNNPAHLSLVKQFSRHTIKRIYVALVKGRMEFDEGIIDLPIGRHKTQRKKMAVGFDSRTKQAKTHYRTLKRLDKYSLIELTPYTGRTHQLRVHLAHLVHPILGDKKYSDVGGFKRMYLHAKYLGFIHPAKNKFVEFSTDIPQEFSIQQNP